MNFMSTIYVEGYYQLHFKSRLCLSLFHRWNRWVLGYMYGTVYGTSYKKECLFQLESERDELIIKGIDDYNNPKCVID